MNVVAMAIYATDASITQHNTAVHYVPDFLRQ